jgi:hypothetical protein
MATPVSFSRWFGPVSMPVLSSRAGLGFTWLAKPAVEFVLVFRVVHRQFEDLDAGRGRRVVMFLAHRTPRYVSSRR